MSTSRFKGALVLGAVALSVGCGASMPEVQNPFRGGAGRATPEQVRVTEAQQELARAKLASGEARSFKQDVLAEREAIAQRGTAKGARLSKRETARLEAWRAKNAFADEQFKLRRQQESVAMAELAAAKAARDRARVERGPWMGREASVKLLKTGQAESRARDKLYLESVRLERAQRDAYESFVNWQDQNPRVRRTPTM